MKRNLQRMIAFILAVMIFSTCTLPYGDSNSKGCVYAATMSKAQINKKMKELEGQITKLNTKYKSELSKEKSETKGYMALIGAPLEFGNYSFIKDLVGRYYYVTNPSALSASMVMVAGYIKPTGGTVVYYENGTPRTCTSVVAKKVTIKSNKTKAQIDSKKKTLQAYKTSLKDALSLKNVSMMVGDTKSVKNGWKYSGKYNKVTFKSSNPSIAKVDANGKVTGKKEGKTTITATANLSGKTTKCTVVVSKYISKISVTQDSYDIYAKDLSSGKLKLNYSTDAQNSPENIRLKSSNEKVVKGGIKVVNGKKLELTMKAIGTTTITLYTDKGAKTSFDVNYFGDKIIEMSPQKDEIIYDYDYRDEYDTLKLYLKTESGTENEYMHEKVTVGSSDASIADVKLCEDDWENYDYANYIEYSIIEGSKAGTAVITFTTDSGLTTTCKITIPKNNGYNTSEDDENYYNYYEDNDED